MTEAWPDVQTAFPERHARQQMLPAWSQDALRDAKVLVAGCGTLGNEVAKNLALLGVGTLGLLDHDLVEEVNLGTSVLFRGEDTGRSKAAVAAVGCAELAPGIRTETFPLDLTNDLGEGVLAGFDLVLGCLDGIHARWKLNRLCHNAGVPWIDAGIENFAGQIASFDGADGPCYECGMTASMWERLDQRRRCVLPASRPGTRAVATSIALAALIASLQVHEAVTLLHRKFADRTPGQWPALASGDRVLASLVPYHLAVVHGRRSPLCMAHRPAGVQSVDSPYRHDQMTIQTIFADTSAHRLELDWEVVSELHCERCGATPVCIADFRLADADLLCPTCGDPRQPLWTHTVEAADALAGRTPAALGVPDRGWIGLITTQERPLIYRLRATGDMRT